MRLKRIVDPDPALDKLEQDWWNENAELVERIWAQTPAIQKSIRLPYLKKMRSFFLRGAAGKKIKILEVGCGSGWVCRHIAGPDVHITGTDFSEKQLEIARENATKENKSSYCSYELADASYFPDGFDGVVIHAVLHHLSEKELRHFFSVLKKIRKGTKVFFYEPFFINPTTRPPSLAEKVLSNLSSRIKYYAMKTIAKSGEKDHALVQKLDNIAKLAEENGWYISPKEVPFREGELESYLSADFTLKDRYFVNKTDLEISQMLGYYRLDQKPSPVFTNFFIPAAIMLDRWLFRRNFRPYIPENSHVFACLEYIKN